MIARPPTSGEGPLIEIAKNQPEYQTLPSRIAWDGLVTTEWEPTAEELAMLMRGGRVRIQILTFNQPLQPLKVEVVGG